MTVTTREVRRLVARFDQERRSNGIRQALSEVAQTTYGYAAFPLFRTNRHPEKFWVLGREYLYFRHPYNRAWMNERSVELSLALDFLSEAVGRTLELGNVTSHYVSPAHDVLDKYENYPGVINEDIISYAAEPYDNILSISTIEHVGWDESPREPEKVLQAYRSLVALLRHGGRMLVTCPLGYNSYLDQSIFDGSLTFERTAFLMRVSQANIWVEVDVDRAHGACYGSPFANANVVFVGRIDGASGDPSHP